jgi:hypothetical protein
MTEKYTEDKRLLGALDYIDEKYIAEVTEDYEIFDYVGKPTRKMRFRIARQYLIYAACLALLACAMPIVSYIVPQIGEIFGGNAGNIGDSETVDLGEFADMSERDLIEHVGKVPKRFKEIVEKNIFRKNFSSDDYVLAFIDNNDDGDIIVYDKNCKVVDVINFENGDPIYGSYKIYRLSDGNYIKLGSYSSSYRYYRDSKTSERIEKKAYVEVITSDGKTVFKTEFDVRNDLDVFYELDDGYVVAGWEQKWNDTVNQQYYIYKLDKSGNIVHQRNLDDVSELECIGGELIVYTRQRQFMETIYIDVFRKHYLNDDLSTRVTVDGVAPNAYKSKRIEDYIPDFNAGYVSSVIEYDDFVLIISERNTKWFEYVPMVYSSIPSYTETVYTAYTYDAEIIWRSAVDSTDYERLAEIKKEYEEEQERFKKWKSENE